MLELEARRPTSSLDESRVVHVLAGYLLASPRFYSPGVDGASVADVVATEYPTASAAGWVPHPLELAQRHPELVEALASFFGADTAPTGLAC